MKLQPCDIKVKKINKINGDVPLLLMKKVGYVKNVLRRKKMKEKLWSDLIAKQDKDLENAKTDKEVNNILKQTNKEVIKSIGWIESNEVLWKRDKSNETKTEEMWDVIMEDGGIYEANNQFEAEVLSLLSQINVRLRRMEENKNGRNTS